MEVIISESQGLSSIPPPPHHPPISIPHPPPNTTTTQHALKREGENRLCLSPPFKQKTSSDLERPTTLLSSACVYMDVCVCVSSAFFPFLFVIGLWDIFSPG